MLDNYQIESNWPKIKRLILSHWDRLTEADVEKTSGDISSLGKLIEESYGAKEDFDYQYERLCESIIAMPGPLYIVTNPVTVTNSGRSIETEIIETAMDKDRDDMYLLNPYGVTRKTETNDSKIFLNTLTGKKSDQPGIDGFHNAQRAYPDYKEKEFLMKKTELKIINGHRMSSHPIKFLNERQGHHFRKK
jgi:hypothetical protein